MKSNNDNLVKIKKSIPQNFSNIAWKSILYSSIIICWGVIIFGTYLLLK